MSERVAPALIVAAIAVAGLGQLALDGQRWLAGAVGYLLAAGLAGWAGFAAQPGAPGALCETTAPRAPTLPWRLNLTLFALGCAGAAFVLSTGNRYRPAQVVPWLLAVGCFWVAQADWRGVIGTPDDGLQGRLRRWLRPNLQSAAPAPWRPWLLLTTRRSELVVLVLLLAILALGAWFRFAELSTNPLDMNSDQAEKLLDITDLLAGDRPIFFERNTGREPWQFYWTLGLIRVFGLRPDFMALKIGTALIGWLMLPAIFLLAREVLGTRGALVATLFAAVCSWGVITARFGLRYPLAPCAVAWTLAHLVRGLRRGSRNELLLAGFWVGVGLQGYTAYRFMVVVAPMLVGLWCGWLALAGQRARIRPTLVSAGVALTMAILVLLPLIRYGVERPDQIFYRAATRLTGAEQAIVGSPLLIFFDNLKNVLLMFHVTADEVWVANLPDRPALDPLLAALLAVGAAFCVVRSLRTHNPWPVLILLAGVAMLVPSALSIAFPRENPSVVRTGGALPALMVVCAAGPAALLELARGRRRLVGALTLAGILGLSAVVASINRERVFRLYPAQYCKLAQNASDIARAMDAWVARGNDRRNAWIVGYPYWVDTRAVGIWIGEITFPNTVMGPQQTLAVDLGGRPGWFVLHPDDQQTLWALRERYPQGRRHWVEGAHCAGRAFVVFESVGTP